MFSLFQSVLVQYRWMLICLLLTPSIAIAQAEATSEITVIIKPRVGISPVSNSTSQGLVTLHSNFESQVEIRSANGDLKTIGVKEFTILNELNSVLKPLDVLIFYPL